MGSYGAALRKWDLPNLGTSVSWHANGMSQHYSATSATTAAMFPQGVPIFVRGGDTPRWLSAAKEALNVLLALPAGWNSYAAKQIDIAVVKDTMELLSAAMDDNATRLPTIVPVSNGGVLLEWQTADADLEAIVLPSGRVKLLFERVGAQTIEQEFLTQEAYAVVRELLRSF